MKKGNQKNELKKISCDLLVSKILRECSVAGHGMSTSDIKRILEGAYEQRIESEGVRNSIDRVRGAYEVMARFDNEKGSRSKKKAKTWFFFKDDEEIIDNLRLSSAEEVKEERKTASTAPNAKRVYRMDESASSLAHEKVFCGSDAYQLIRLLRQYEGNDEARARIENTLLGFLNVFERTNVERKLKLESLNLNSGLYELSQNENALEKAIKDHQYVSFEYRKGFERDINGRVIKTEAEKVEKVQPLFKGCKDGRYYLVVKAKRSHKAKSGKRIYYRIFRLDRIAYVETGGDIDEASQKVVAGYSPSPEEFFDSMVEGIPSVDIVDVLVRCVGGKRELAYLREAFDPECIYELDSRQKAELGLADDDNPVCVIMGVSSEGMVRWALKRLSRIEVLGDRPNEVAARKVSPDALCDPRFFEGTLRADVIEAIKTNVYGLELCAAKAE